MTIFHVLKYPVSTPPTHQEIMAMPYIVYSGYLHEYHHRYISPAASTALVRKLLLEYQG